MNKIAPFSPHQIEYLKRTETCWFNVAEGGKRGGKNVLQTLAYCNILETHKDKLHLIAGVSTTTARLNIADCDGFGIFNFFKGRYKTGKYQNRACINILTKTGKKVILVSGGGKNGDERYIKGNTYGTAYVTEANECSKSFLNEVMDRTMSSSNRKVFHDLNPKDEKHWYYQEVLAYHEKKQKDNPAYGLNYGHFTIADNYSISNEKLKKILETYDQNSIWYKRDIKGKRCSAEGLIYQAFADNPGEYLIDSINETDENGIKKYHIDYIRVGVDFGGNGSQHSFVATAICNRMKYIIPLCSKVVQAKDTNPKDLEREFKLFILSVHDQYKTAMRVRCDSAEQVLINGLKQMSAMEKLPIEIMNAQKKPIVDRIRLLCFLLSTHRIKLLKSATKSLQMAISSAVWDTTKYDDVRLDNGTSDIDTMDAFEYSIEEDMKTIIAIR